MMDQEKSELVCFSSGDEEEDEQGVRKKAEEPNVSAIIKVHIIDLNRLEFLLQINFTVVMSL